MKILWIFSVLLLVGCADPARNLYEGVKGANDAKRTPNERAVSPAPSYDFYQKELKRLNK